MIPRIAAGSFLSFMRRLSVKSFLFVLKLAYHSTLIS